MCNFIRILFLLIYISYFVATSAITCWNYSTTSNGSNLAQLYESPAAKPQIIECPDDPHVCYAVWKVTNGSISLEKQGCFGANEECLLNNKCVEKGVGVKGFLYCCCRHDLCNANYTWEPTTTVTPPTTEPTEIHNDDTVLSCLVILFLSSIMILLIIMYLLNKRKYYFNQISDMEPGPRSVPSTPPIEKLRPLKLEEVIARGKFGAVWKASDKNEKVAVKILPAQEKQAWLTEQEIMRFPHMIHDNILRLVAAEKRGDALLPEFWLITAYHPNGSLHDYLKSNVITWKQFCSIGYTMARGLTHLHEEILPIRGDDFKPAIAHRDFKSSNVLLKNDFTACIADFDLALVFKPNRACGVTHGQVGTRRYMAPEVLEGAINFSRDSFLRIDMYAFGLVLWELASRCSSIHQGPVPDYKLPFEAEIGPHPSLEDMQEIVVQQKRRPIIKQSWYCHPGFACLYCSIEECWDHDSEARVSASCIMERFLEHMKFSKSPNTPLLYDSVTNNSMNTINSDYANHTNAYIAV